MGRPPKNPTDTAVIKTSGENKPILNFDLNELKVGEAVITPEMIERMKEMQSKVAELTIDQRRAKLFDTLKDAQEQAEDLINDGNTVLGAILGFITKALGRLQYIQPSLGQSLKPTDELPLK